MEDVLDLYEQPYDPKHPVICFDERLCHNRDLLLRQPVQLINQRVDLPVSRLDLPLQSRLLVRRADQGELLMQGEHLFHLRDPEGGLRGLDLAAINESTACESNIFQNFIFLPILLLLRQAED